MLRFVRRKVGLYYDFSVTLEMLDAATDKARLARFSILLYRPSNLIQFVLLETLEMCQVQNKLLQWRIFVSVAGF